MKKNMASEQGIYWLRSMAKDRDVFNSINAENCLALIDKLQKDIRDLGVRYNAVKKDRDRYLRVLDEARVKALDEQDIPFAKGDFQEEEDW